MYLRCSFVTSVVKSTTTKKPKCRNGTKMPCQKTSHLLCRKLFPAFVVVCALKEEQLFVTMKMASVIDDNFNNSWRECTKVVHMPSTNRYFFAVPADCNKTHISRDSYNIWLLRGMASCPSNFSYFGNTRFRKMLSTMYDGDKSQLRCMTPQKDERGILGKFYCFDKILDRIAWNGWPVRRMNHRKVRIFSVL